MFKSSETEESEGKLGVTVLASINEHSGCFHYGANMTTVSLMGRYSDLLDTCQIILALEWRESRAG